MKKLVYSITIALFVFLNCMVANATSMIDLSMESNSDSVDAGSEIIIYLKLNSVSEIESLTGLTGELEYNKRVFELVSMSAAEGSQWLITPPIKNSKFSALYQAVEGSKSGNIAKMVFRTIGSPANGTSSITIRNIVFTDSKIEDLHEDITYEITVKDPETSSSVPTLPKDPVEPSTPDTPTEPSGSTNTEDEVKPVKPANPTIKNNTKEVSNNTVGQTNQDISNKNGDGTTAKSKIPEAGINITILILMASAIVLGTATFIRYKKTK